MVQASVLEVVICLFLGSGTDSNAGVNQAGILFQHQLLNNTFVIRHFGCIVTSCGEAFVFNHPTG